MRISVLNVRNFIYFISFYSLLKTPVNKFKQFQTAKWNANLLTNYITSNQVWPLPFPLYPLYAFDVIPQPHSHPKPMHVLHGWPLIHLIYVI